MPKQEIVEVEDKKPSGNIDWNHIANCIYEKYKERKQRRADREKMWAEVDRQIRLEPDVVSKRHADGDADKNDWFPEMELPDQATAHEILKSDAQRMMFPENGAFFKVFGDINEKILKAYKNFEFLEGEDVRIAHEQTGGIEIDQEDINMVTQSFIEHNLYQYDYKLHWDMVYGESFKYGMGVGRMRNVKKTVVARTSQGSIKRDVSIPIMIPRSVKNVYLDDTKHSVMNEGYQISLGDVEARSQMLVDLQVAAQKGTADVKDENGGWMAAELKGLKGDDNGLVQLLEYEGDLVVPKKEGGSYIFYNYIITIVCGQSDDKEAKQIQRVIRVRQRTYNLPSLITAPYDIENVECPYGSSPLMKGYAIQKGGSETFNNLMAAVMLNGRPVLRYDQDDAIFSANGGLDVFPGAQIPSMGAIDVLEIGDVNSLLAAYRSFREQYAEVTGITAPRMGQQTVSHTTAFAKNSEMQRGTVRTVDFVRSVMGSPMQQFLHLTYEMGKANLKDETPIFLNKVKMFAKVGKELMPDHVKFEIYGSQAPAEDAARSQAKIAAIQLSMNIDQIKVSMGLGEPLNYEELQKEILREGGIEDVERLNIQNSRGANPKPALPSPDQGAGVPGTTSTALQGINFGQR